MRCTLGAQAAVYAVDVRPGAKSAEQRRSRAHVTLVRLQWRSAVAEILRAGLVSLCVRHIVSGSILYKQTGLNYLFCLHK